MAKKFIPHFEGFESDSPKSSFAQKMVTIPKIIFSRTLHKPFDKNTSLAKENLAVEIARIFKYGKQTNTHRPI